MRMIYFDMHTCKSAKCDLVPSMDSDYEYDSEDDYSVEWDDYERSPDEGSSGAAHLTLYLSFRHSGDKQINGENGIQVVSTEENRGIIRKQDKFQEKLLTTQAQLEDIFCSSTNGTLLWSITNVAEKIADARSERHASIYSPIFYTSTTGYKMRARLDMNGFDSARATHMSVFLILLKGDYDAELTWPFTLSVTFCLYDQTGAGRHVIDTYYPGTRSFDVVQPGSRINIGYAVPKYCPLGILEGSNSSYIRDDTMFLGVTINFDTQGKVPVPYTVA
ncbi:unnamed protein product [Adineta ricciae]|uniref:MATH domain-containing protein n=1 Tax=Adineta ricciae TaxID=249248 RepID=A0A813WXX7_ADIRI|nr:unnamed protein product [Adineta ricciae]